jgi:RimJ/RimL family protein N-acetyltransferase
MKISRFEKAFNDYVKNDPQSFLEVFFSPDSKGEPSAQGIIYEVDDVGILYLTEIRPGVSALAHFNFWDQRFRGREELCRAMLRYAFGKFKFHRITAQVGLYAKPELVAVERIGFVKEGRMREATIYKGEWFDVNLYSILEREVQDADAKDDTGDAVPSDSVRGGLSSVYAGSPEPELSVGTH